MRHLLLLPPALLAGCGASTPEAGPGRGVLVVAVDAFRWDHTSFAGYDRDTTPQLAAWFGQNGTVFADAWTPGPLLEPGHLALLTGCDPTVARTPDVVLSDGSTLPPVTEWFVAPGVPTLAEEFLASGWHTAAFVDHFEQRRGIERGFRVFEEEGGGRGEEWKPLLKGVGRRFMRWVDDLDHGEDWFAYVHIHDLEARWGPRWEQYGEQLDPLFGPRPELDHVPPVSVRSPAYFTLPANRVLAGSPTLGEYEAHYDSALHWIDETLRRVLIELDQLDRLERTTLVIAGTYGVGFGEAGMLVASGTLSPVDLHVPLLMRPAPTLGLEPEGRVEHLVGLADVAPTLLSLHGLPVPAGMHGVDLVPLLRGHGALPHDALFASHSVSAGFAVVTEEHQYAWWDPGERGPASPLAVSWFGSPRGRDDTGVRVLVARDTPVTRWLSGELAPGQEDALAAGLHARGAAWYADLDRAREVLHPSAWNTAARRPALVEELRRKGLIGEPE